MRKEAAICGRRHTEKIKLRTSNLLAAAVAMLLYFAGGNACAQTPQTFTAKITNILLCEACNNTVYVYPEGGLPNPPACQTNGPYISFNINRPMGKAYLAALLAAQMSSKPVFFRTAGACIDQSVADTLVYFQVNTQ